MRPLLVLAALAAIAAPALAAPAALYVLDVPRDMNVYAAAWRPDGSEALVVGGSPANPMAGAPERAFVYRYDGGSLEPLHESSGAQAVDVAWAPDGSYALVVTTGRPILRYDPATRSLTDVWTGLVHVADAPTAVFHGARVAFRPGTGVAYVTGSSLLAYDGSALHVVEPGENRIWRHIAFRPDGALGLVSGVEADEAGYLRPGALYALTPASGRLSFVTYYGKHDVSAEVHGVTWDAARDRFLAYGDDGGRGTLLAWSPAGGSAFLDFEKDQGRIRHVAFRPGDARYGLVATEAGTELMETDGESFAPVLDERRLTGDSSIYYRVAWQPDGASALVTGFGGRLYERVVPTGPGVTARVEADGAPSVRGIATPRNSFVPIRSVNVVADGTTLDVTPTVDERGRARFEVALPGHAERIVVRAVDSAGSEATIELLASRSREPIPAASQAVEPERPREPKVATPEVAPAAPPAARAAPADHEPDAPPPATPASSEAVIPRSTPLGPIPALVAAVAAALAARRRRSP